jgi:hypothetical protein
LEIDTNSGVMTLPDSVRIASTDVKFSAPSLSADGPSQTYRSVSFCTQSRLRFDMGIETSPEVGNAAGSNFYVNCFSDAGDFLSTAITITRSTGAVFFNGSPALSLATLRAEAFNATGVPSAALRGPGALIYVSDEAGGPILAFSDGVAWRRTTDRAIIA